MSASSILNAKTLPELIEAIDEFCIASVFRDDDNECLELKDRLENSVENDYFVILSSYMAAAEDGDEIIDALYEFADNCRGFVEADKEVTEQITKDEFEAVLDECEEKCAARTCIEKEHRLNVAEINMFSENDELCRKIKNGSINLFLPRVDINTSAKQYIAGELGIILYDTLKTKLAPEYIKQEMNRYIPETRKTEEATRQLFKKYFYDVVLYQERKPGIYPNFDEHMQRVIVLEFFKRIIVQYLKE